MSLAPPFDIVPFPNDTRAKQLLDSLNLDEVLAQAIATVLKSACNPERVLTRLKHFLDAAGASERTRIGGDARYATLLCTVFDQSQLITDTLCNDAALRESLHGPGALDAARTTRTILDAYQECLSTDADLKARMRELRHTHRRELVRIGMRDVFVHAPMRVITRELSELADALTAAAIEAAEAELVPRYGEPMCASTGTRAGFVVLGMGKLGGRELNFSSDIDLVFIYAEDGDCTGGSGRVLTNEEYFTKLGELVIKILTEDTAEGRVYRVDMRLRPHGRFAPLARTLGSTVDYFEQHGRPWERQALIKARPIAGDVALGEALLREVRPFVFPKYFDDATLDEIRSVKGQVETHVAERGETATEVKLGRGGIRDIEFTVQMLQLLNGGRNPALRVRNTLDAIDALGRHGLLSPFNAQTLASNYTYLREIEHRLQIEGGQQRHALPDDSAVLADFACRLGYGDAEAFRARYRDRSEQTRRILEHFYDTEGAGNLWITGLLNREAGAQPGLERLARMGFRDPEGAREELLDLYLGPDIRPHSAHIRQAFRRAAPLLLEHAAASPRPDEVLLRLGRMLTNLKAPGAMYDLLSRRSALCEALVTVISNSYYLTDIVIRNPELFDVFGHGAILERAVDRDTLETELAQLQAAREPEAALYRLHQAHTLRVGLRDLLGKADVVEVGHELSVLADVCVQAAFEESLRTVVERYGEAHLEFAVLGLGKLGGRELGYGSDLDLMFVYRGDGPEAVSATEYTAAIAIALMRRLKERTRYGALYDVDARLRPDGQKGPLTVSEERFRSYYVSTAQGWERLVLVKARGIAGHTPFLNDIERAAHEIAFSRPLTPEEIAHTEDLRARLAAQAGALDLKRGEGGLAELEFVVRIRQLKHAQEFEDLRRSDVLGALDALAQRGLIEPGDAEILRDAYLNLRRIENRIRMFDGTATSALPADEEGRQELAARLGMEGDLVERVAAWKRMVHAAYKGLTSS